MVKIDNTHDANIYYKLINDFIDKYIVKWKIKPSKLSNYLKNNDNLEQFIIKNDLKEISNIKKIINDIMEDRTGIEYDGVLKFENFSLLNENLINLGLSDVSYEKVLADLYNIGLSHIVLFRKDLNYYRITDFDKVRYAIIYSNKELLQSISNIKYAIKKSILLSYHEINDLDDYRFSLDIMIGDIIDNNKLSSKLDELVNNNFFLLLFKQYLFKIFKKHFKYQEYKGYFIMEII